MSMSLERARHLAVALWVIALATTAAFVGLVLVNAPSPGPLEFADFLFMMPIYAAVMMTLPTVGALLVARRPDNAIGWMFCGSGIAMAAGFCLQLYGDTALYLHPALPGGEAAIAVGNPLFIVGMATGTFFMMFLFPTGRPLPGVLRWVFLVLSAGFVISIVGSVFAPTLAVPFEGTANPLAIPGLEAAAQAAAALLDSMAPVVALAAVVSLVVRFRRSRGVERQQMKWFASAASFMGGSLALAFSLSALGLQLASDVMWVSAMLGLAFLPVAVGMAVLRYRLYDIDRLVSRTLSYAAVTGVLLGVYALGVMGLGRALAPFTRESDLAVAASTLLAVALFTPVRRRVQTAVDRRFNRARYDAQQTIEAFASHLRETAALEDLHTELLDVVDLSVEPAWTSLWLRHAR